MIKDFKINQRGNKLGTAVNFHISTSHFNVLKSVWVDVLKKEESNITSPKDGFNLFENDNINLCAAIGIGLGCDVCPKGAPGVGISAIKSLIESGSGYDDLLSKFSEKCKLDINVLKAYHCAIVFEPGLLTTDSDKTTKYIHHSPPSLPLYCEEFSTATTTIDTSLKLKTCSSINNEEHLFMELEPHFQCSRCASTICNHCKAVPCNKLNVHEKDVNLCLGCYNEEVNGDKGTNQTLQSMRAILQDKYNVHDVNNLNINKTEQLFDEYEVKQQEDAEYFPLYPVVPAYDYFFERDKEAVGFAFSDGAHFIQDERLNTKQICDLIAIFKGLITYSSLQDTSKHKHVRAVTDIVAEVARGARKWRATFNEKGK